MVGLQALDTTGNARNRVLQNFTVTTEAATRPPFDASMDCTQEFELKSECGVHVITLNPY